MPIAESSTEDGAALPLDFPDSGPNPEDSCLQREQERILCAAVNELKPGLRKAVELREFGELSTGETAQVMGLSVAAVKARLIHGRTEPGRCDRRPPASDFDRTKASTKGGGTMTRLSFLEWWRILWVHHQWTM